MYEDGRDDVSYPTDAIVRESHATERSFATYRTDDSVRYLSHDTTIDHTRPRRQQGMAKHLLQKLSQSGRTVPIKSWLSRVSWRKEKYGSLS
ncbi:uncharacterized protein RCC_01865 [Ramularia collo-cygni]|uniref:Uncharacterized protein n=1 Tax=Ramularia collo-cygni TaxID=112498 RepID=A0A2D3URB2_9PEZI|nr:uncharacterized protein RCC_01865 [Ramularia collo-cygni]CZT16025.1 uncharacterized protein RCC_01865 [Ramularia collo-cygni]